MTAGEVVVGAEESTDREVPVGGVMGVGRWVARNM